MTIENFFVKKFEKLENEKAELEKDKKGLEIDLSQKDGLLKEVSDLLESGHPKVTAGNYLSLSIFLGDERAEKAKALLRKLNIQIEGEQK